MKYHGSRFVHFLRLLLLAVCAVFASLGLAGDNQCLDCHGEQPAVQSILHKVHGQLPSTGFGATASCQSCHGPSLSHMDKPTANAADFVFSQKQSGEAQNDRCLACHSGSDQKAWHISEHAAADVACSSCHNVHAERDPVLVKGQQQTVCYSCHKSQQLDSTKFSRHPIREGQVACSDCHDTHGGKGPGMLKEATVNETCYQCHTEKRGPFLWEHEPVQDDCTHCHTPHGSVNDNLLAVRTPFLCQQCHIDTSHRGYNYATDEVLPGGSRSHYAQAKGCLNCHGEIHGTNHASGGGYFE